MPWNYYNERNKYAAQWLRNLMRARLIAPGVVDERSIADVAADDLEGFRQCHFFAGVGAWSYALRKRWRFYRRRKPWEYSQVRYWNCPSCGTLLSLNNHRNGRREQCGDSQMTLDIDVPVSSH